MDTPPAPDDTPTVTPTPAVRTQRTLQVHVGPGPAYAVIGTIAGGEDVEVVGRDDDGEWIAIAFPPNSTARGWLQADNLTGLALSRLIGLAVVGPTPLSLSPATSTPGVGEGGTPVTPSGTSTTEPRGPNVGAVDLLVTDVSLLEDGTVAVTIGNLGPGDLARGIVLISVRNLTGLGETLIYEGDLDAGAAVTMTTSSFVVTNEQQIIATVDPGSALRDSNRSNNTLNATLAPNSATVGS